MTEQNRNTVKREVRTIFCLTVASAVIAFNLKSFVETGGLFPGGFSGVTILIQEICARFFDISLPYSAVYLPLNLVPAYLGVKYISKRFTFYSFYVVVLSGLLTDVFPSVTITYDTLLISIFGGIINGACMSICLINGASGGGTDFISIFFSEKKGVDAWSYILMGNIVVLVTAGVLFGFDRALYSIIYQYVNTQIIQLLFKRYQKDTMFIITSVPDAVYAIIRRITHHDATLIDGTGCFEGSPRHILYSVIGREHVDQVISEIKKVDPKAFINVINTEQVNGKFYKRPY